MELRRLTLVTPTTTNLIDEIFLKSYLFDIFESQYSLNLFKVICSLFLL
jgi:hypothetical protein